VIKNKILRETEDLLSTNKKLKDAIILIVNACSNKEITNNMVEVCSKCQDVTGQNKS